MSENSRIALCVREDGGDRGDFGLGMPAIASQGLGNTFSLSEGQPMYIVIGDDDTAGGEGTGLPGSRSADAPGKNSRDTEDAVTEIIRRLGIPANIKGYRYIRTAVMMCLDDPELLESVTGRLYPKIAHCHSSTPTRVERAIRHAITVAWDRAEGDEEYVSRRLHCRIDFSSQRPTNSELIALISDSLMLEGRPGNGYQR